MTVTQEAPARSHVFRFLLLTPEEVGMPHGGRRIENLYLLNGGRTAAIIFLVDESEAERATKSFMDLQTGLGCCHPHLLFSTRHQREGSQVTDN